MPIKRVQAKKVPKAAPPEAILDLPSGAVREDALNTGDEREMSLLGEKVDASIVLFLREV